MGGTRSRPSARSQTVVRGGVYAVPVTRNFYASHQWLRELKRRNQGPAAGIYFRVPDEQLVWVGHYGHTHRLVTAAEAIAQFMGADDPLGWEVVVPRRIEANEIHKARRLPRVIGWGFSPKRKVNRPSAPANSALRGNSEARNCDGDSVHLMMSSCARQLAFVNWRNETFRFALNGVKPIANQKLSQA